MVKGAAVGASLKDDQTYYCAALLGCVEPDLGDAITGRTGQENFTEMGKALEQLVQAQNRQRQRQGGSATGNQQAPQHQSTRRERALMSARETAAQAIQEVLQRQFPTPAPTYNPYPTQQQPTPFAPYAPPPPYGNPPSYAPLPMAPPQPSQQQQRGGFQGARSGQRDAGAGFRRQSGPPPPRGPSPRTGVSGEPLAYAGSQWQRQGGQQGVTHPPPPAASFPAHMSNVAAVPGTTAPSPLNQRGAQRG